LADLLAIVMLFLRWIHFVGGVTWIGTIFYLGMVQIPAMRKTGNYGISPENVSKLNTVFIFTSVSNVVAGVSLALVISRLNTGVFTSTVWGLSILVGGLVAMVALATTFRGVIPTMERLSSGELTNNERRELFEKGRTWVNATMALGTVVLLMMAAAGSL
jgi:uncharacterized membrane protein